MDSTPKQKRSPNSERRRKASVGRSAGRPALVPGRPAPTESSHLTVGRPGSRPLLCHGRSGGRPGYVCACRAHRLTARSTSLSSGRPGYRLRFYLSLLQASFLFPLTSGLCAIFLYLLHLLSPYKRERESSWWKMKNSLLQQRFIQN